MVFAISTYRDQQVLNRDQRRLNRDQQALNAMALDREARRYASGVSFWDVGPYTRDKPLAQHVTEVRIRNSTAMPVNDVVLVSVAPQPGRPAYRPVVAVRTIAPCQEVKVWVERQDLYRAWRRMHRDLDMAGVPLWASAGMYFRVAGTDWELTNRALRPVTGRHFDGMPQGAGLDAAQVGEEAWVTATQTAACGGMA